MFDCVTRVGVTFRVNRATVKVNESPLPLRCQICQLFVKSVTVQTFLSLPILCLQWVKPRNFGNSPSDDKLPQHTPLSARAFSNWTPIYSSSYHYSLNGEAVNATVSAPINRSGLCPWEPARHSDVTEATRVHKSAPGNRSTTCHKTPHHYPARVRITEWRQASK